MKKAGERGAVAGSIVTRTLHNHINIFTRLYHTSYRPEKPLMIWDGQCGFCHYWVIRWQGITADAVDYKPYQEALEHIGDIPEWACREAARLVDIDGTIYNGPEAAYKALWYADQWRGLLQAYDNSDLFRYLSDHGYTWIARHRAFLFSITKALWGKNPSKPKKYWLYYLLGIIAVLLSAVFIPILK